MKKLIFVIFIICALCLSGCTSEKEVAALHTENNFIVLDKNKGIVYDSNTEITYYVSLSYNGYVSYTPFIGSNKDFVTKDEYLERYIN